MRRKSWLHSIAGAAILCGIALTPSAAHAATGWTQLGRTLDTARQIEVAHNADGRLEVFAWTAATFPAPDQLYHNWQLRGGGWSGWYSLGASDGDFSLVNEADGRIRVFQATATTVRTIAQNGPDGGWGSWQDMGVPSGNYEHVAAARDPWGRLHLFSGRNERQGIVEVHQTRANGPFGAWTDSGAPIADRYARFLVAPNADGRPEVFFSDLGSDQVKHRWQTLSAAWSPWVGLPHLPSSDPYQLDVIGQSDGRMDVVTRLTPASKVSAIAQNGPNGGWPSSWRAPNLPGTTGSRSLHHAQNADGRPELYQALTASGLTTLLRSVQTAPNSDTWRDAVAMDPPSGYTLDEPGFASATDSQGVVWIFAEVFGSIVFQHQSTPGVW